MNESTVARGALENPAVHEHWLNDFYEDCSRVLYDRAFDRIVRVFGSRPKSTVLDAGCGTGSHAIRLALRGYPVLAMDFSEYILERARANVAAHDLGHMVTISHGSASCLPIEDDSLEFVLCWNVLMVIPQVERAVAELCRVVRPGGFLIIAEDNMWSLEALLVRTARRILHRAGLRGAKGKEFAPPKISAAGAEYWHHTDEGPLVSRVARISWLTAQVAGHGFELEERIAFELLDPHIVPGALKRYVPQINRFWFEQVRFAPLAMNNVLIFQKCARSG